MAISQTDLAWRRFLDQELRVPLGLFPDTQVDSVLELMEQLRDRLGPRLAVPLTQPTVDGAIQLAWDAGRHYLDIDIFSDGTMQWFYRDRETKELDGSPDEKRVTGVSPELERRLKVVLP
jgi:hypothetical protein